MKKGLENSMENEEQLKRELEFYKNFHDEVLSSNSWKMTAPLRNFVRKMKRGVRKIQYKLSSKRFCVEGFDRDYYLQNNPDVAASGMDPLEHYVLYGREEGRIGICANGKINSRKNFIFPCNKYNDHLGYLSKKSTYVEGFDRDYYLQNNPDVAASGMDPLEHYVLYGREEGRAIGKDEGCSDLEIGEGFNQEVSQDNIVEERESFDDKTRKYISYDSVYQHNVICDEQPKVKAIAYFLPQFHTFPENDKWWGKGFTEWTNTRKAAPCFDGHYQPREPHEDIGYYDLSDVGVLKKQVKLAKDHGIYGFCFYYYWFSGKKLMYKPSDLLMRHSEIDIKFCLCWANESWTRAWDGSENECLIQQEYLDQDPQRFIEDLKPYFDDKRYIRVHNKPVIVVYRPMVIPKIREVIKTWRKVAREIGIGEIEIWACRTFGIGADNSAIRDLIDHEVEFPPHNMTKKDISISMEVDGCILDYSKMVNDVMYERKKDSFNDRVYRAVTLGWDNSARRQKGYTIFANFSIVKYYEWLRYNVEEALLTYEEDERFVFINAWNEWAEGTYLEPDKKFGYTSINVTTNALLRRDLDIKFSYTKRDFVKNRIAIQVHIFYEEVFEEICSYLNNMPEDFDLYITTVSTVVAKHVFEECKKYCKANKVEIAVVYNCGRDVAPFLIQMQDNVKQYEYFCHIHTKKSKHSGFGDDWRKYLLDNLLGIDKIDKLIRAFDNCPNVGIIYPPPYSCIVDWMNWGSNRDLTRILLKILKVDISLSTFGDRINFPAGNMFWARTSAVRQLFEHSWSWNDFPDEEGQTDCTIMHAIERVWSMVVKYNGYNVLILE